MQTLDLITYWINFLIKLFSVLAATLAAAWAVSRYYLDTKYTTKVELEAFKTDMHKIIKSEIELAVKPLLETRAEIAKTSNEVNEIKQSFLIFQEGYKGDRKNTSLQMEFQQTILKEQKEISTEVLKEIKAVREAQVLRQTKETR